MFIYSFQVENVRLIDRFNHRQQIIGKDYSTVSFNTSVRFSGTIYLTSTHLIFADLEAKRETWVD